ncbi:GNAT family N-acetyltransferase [Dactylosporangium vinaceum]|uniref:GNAT family N-acetyltransferase n=1 Tax=Dactylosporangium vinaceum TaxID=53362 RepID=A0ABV5MIY3_9ACTN|nr:GNAT family N-acetyltransferase [Dactylosporangium vinaceum]UAB93722.1 GNAT family N-acetyltransferase [Dactylosporangium vinaceum]
MGDSLAALLDAAAAGRFPPPDGGVSLLPQPSPRDAGVIAFTAHSAVFVDEDPAWLRAQLAATGTDRLAAPMHPRFLTALSDRTGRTAETIDLLTVATALAGPPPLDLRQVDAATHPRVVRARTRRADVRAYATEGALLVIGRGVAGRWEAAIEVEEPHRHRGLGRSLALAARHLVPDGAPIWSQQAPGNARSVRTFQAAGYRPVGAEALLVRPGPA